MYGILLVAIVTHAAVPLLLQALDVLHCVHDLGSLSETRAVCHFIFQLSRYKSQWQFALPAQHRDLLRAVVQLSGSCVAVLSKRATLKRAVKTMYASGLLPPEQGPPGDKKASKVVIMATGGMECEDDDAWVTTTAAYQELLNGYVVCVLGVCVGVCVCWCVCWCMCVCVCVCVYDGSKHLDWFF